MTDITDQTLERLDTAVNEAISEVAYGIEHDDHAAVEAVFNRVAESGREHPEASILFTLALLEKAGGLLVDLIAAEAENKPTEVDTTGTTE